MIKALIKCPIGKNHKWKGSEEKYGESFICIRCGWDALDHYFRRDKQKNTGG